MALNYKDDSTSIDMGCLTELRRGKIRKSDDGCFDVYVDNEEIGFACSKHDAREMIRKHIYGPTYITSQQKMEIDRMTGPSNGCYRQPGTLMGCPIRQF